MKTASPLSARSLQFYAMARKWASDLDFFKIETAFLHRLLQDHFVRLSDTEHIGKLKTIGQQLGNLEKEIVQGQKDLNEQMRLLEHIAEGKMPESFEKLTAAQARLQEMTSELTQEYRTTKKDLFKLVDSVVNKQKLLDH